MPLSNLGDVTRALINLLRWNIPRIDPSMPAFVVSAQAPETYPSGTSTGSALTVHLYHAAEDPAYKNTRGPGSDAPNVAKAPMALTLYYVVTAHHVSNEPTLDPIDAQRIFGLALKTLHDVPVITENTRLLNPATALVEPVLPADILSPDNRLQIIYRTLTPEESIAYWTADVQRGARLSAYYEVRVVMLRPEPAQRIAGPVLGIGAFVLDLASPHLDRSENEVPFTPPPSTGAGPRTVVSAPARVPLVIAPPTNRLVLRGSNLVGRSQTVILRSALWPRMAVPLPERVEVDPTWPVTFAADRVELEVQPQVTQGAQVFDLLPGFYTAAVRVVRREEHILGELKQIVTTSNEVPFAVTPFISGHGAPDPIEDRVRLDLAPTFDLTRIELDERIEVVIQGESYERVNAHTSGDAGDRQFVLASPSTITVQTPFSLAGPGDHAARVIVDGAESQPFWIHV